MIHPRKAMCKKQIGACMCMIVGGISGGSTRSCHARKKDDRLRHRTGAHVVLLKLSDLQR